MDPVRNPYAPGAGNPPPELAGRVDLLALARTALERVEQGRHAQGLILVGLRGVGKTVLLNAVDEIGRELRLERLKVEVHEGKRLVNLLVPQIRSAMYSLSVIEAARQSAQRALRILKSFVHVVKLTIEGMDLSIEPELGKADSGDLELDLPDLFEALGDTARLAKRPIVLILDELQYLQIKEFSALIMSMHRISQRQLPMVLIGAGLPQVRALAGDSKSYAERLFRFPDVGALEAVDARAALEAPAMREGASFDAAALDEVLNITQCYPYFLQQWGYEIWNFASRDHFTLSDVRMATPIAVEELDRSFFKVRFERCTPAERRYMRALAELGSGSHRSGGVAQILGVQSTSAAPIRNKLIKKGMIYSKAHGETEFTAPLFDQYMRRVMPEIGSKND